LRHVQEPPKQRQAARALARLAEEDEHQVLIVQKGALNPLSNLVKSDHLDIQRAAAAALANLALAESNQVCVWGVCVLWHAQH
jgi:hypothetical protein